MRLAHDLARRASSAEAEDVVQELCCRLLSSRKDEPYLLAVAVWLILVWLATLTLAIARGWAWVAGL